MNLLPGDDADTPQDGLELVLTQALTREADAVRPDPDGLTRIRAAIAAGRSRDTGTRVDRSRAGRAGDSRFGHRQVTPLLAAAAAVVLVAGIGAGVVALRGEDQTTATVATSRADTPLISGPLPVFVVAAPPGHLWLVREFARAGGAPLDDRISEAVADAVAGRHTDPDYTTLFAPLTAAAQAAVVASVDPDQGGIAVDLPASLTVARPATRARAELAVQQVVWTATASAGLNVPVRISVGGRSRTQGGDPVLFGYPIPAALFARSAQDDPRAPVWIDSLVDGAVLARGGQTFGGVALDTGSPSVIVTLRRTGADSANQTRVVPLTQSERDPGHVPRAGARSAWTTSFILGPGSYVITATVRDGVSEAGWTDDKVFTVY